MAAMRVRCFPAVFPTDFPGFNFVASTCRVYEMPNKAQYSTQHLDQFWLVEPLNLPKCHASTKKNYGDCYPLAISVSIYILYLFIYMYIYIYIYIYTVLLYMRYPMILCIYMINLSQRLLWQHPIREIGAIQVLHDDVQKSRAHQHLPLRTTADDQLMLMGEQQKQCFRLYKHHIEKYVIYIIIYLYIISHVLGCITT